MNQPQLGDMLIAPPEIPDVRFDRTVLILTQTDSQGSFAMCVNRPTGYVLQDILEGTDLELELNLPLYWGGPVSPGSVWMLHSAEWSNPHTVSIDHQWALTSHISMFQHLADGDYPREFRLIAGYTSWAKGQLESEIKGLPPWNHNHSWLLAQQLGPEWVYDQPVEELWMLATDACSHQAVDAWF